MSTLENLCKAFIGESQARNRYTIYAKIAEKEGYDQISAIFLETAEQEREHAKWIFRLIQNVKKDDTPIMVEADVPNIHSDTITNLKSAAEGEHHETSSMYPEYADQAETDGYPEIAVRLRAIAKAEAHHEERYRKLIKELENKTVFQKAETTTWLCRKCGYQHEGTTPPEKCPSCGHETAYFQIKCEQY